MDDSDVRYLLEVDVWYPGNKLQKPYNNLSLKMIINIIVYTRKFKKALNHGLVFKRVNRFIKFNQKYWLKSYIHMNTES